MQYILILKARCVLQSINQSNLYEDLWRPIPLRMWNLSVDNAILVQNESGEVRSELFDWSIRYAGIFMFIGI